MTKTKIRLLIEIAGEEVLREEVYEANAKGKVVDAEDLCRRALESLSIAAERLGDARGRLAALNAELESMPVIPRKKKVDGV
jgi:hypothetical protein